MEVLQEASGKRFVMKQLLPTKARDASERRAFEFEAKLGMELCHPNLIRVHEFVRDKEQPYFVMDYFPSTHMRLVIAKPDKYALPRGQIAPRHRARRRRPWRIMHENQCWIHRDIKPENIIVSKGGEARLIDFTHWR